MQISSVHPLLYVTHLAVLLKLTTLRDLGIQRVLVRFLHVESLLLLHIEFKYIFSRYIGVPFHLVPKNSVVDQSLRCLVLELRF